MLSVIRPQDDDVSRGLADWWDHIKPFCPGRIAILDPGALPSRRRVVEHAAGAKLILFFGHGRPACLYGPKRTRLLDARNIRAASGAIIIAFACHSGALLAPAAIRLGVRAYIGFTDAFVGPIQEDSEFRAALAEGPRALLEGRTVQEAVEAMTSALEYLAKQFASRGGEGFAALTATEWCLYCLRARGKKRASVTW